MSDTTTQQTQPRPSPKPAPKRRWRPRRLHIHLSLWSLISIGLVAAFRGGWVDSLLMRIVDLQLSFPTILVALILLVILGRGVDKIIFALVVVQWAYFARTVRGVALVENSRDYVEAARSQLQMGGHHPDVLARSPALGGQGDRVDINNSFIRATEFFLPAIGLAVDILCHHQGITSGQGLINRT